MKAVVAAFNQEKAPIRAFSVITNLRMELFEELETTANVGHRDPRHPPHGPGASVRMQHRGPGQVIQKCIYRRGQIHASSSA